MVDLAGGDQVGHCADGLLDGGFGVHTVLVVEVDVVHPEARERGVASPADVLRPAVDTEVASVGRSLVAELCSQHYLVAPSGDGPAYERSLMNGPYMSAVSRNETPISSALWIVATDSSSSPRP